MLVDKELKSYLCNLFKDWSGETCTGIVSLSTGSGSYRRYFRMEGDGGVSAALGVFNENVKENVAFLSFTEHFLSLGFSVPSVYFVDSSKQYYLLEDLGDSSLFSLLSGVDRADNFPRNVVDIYKSVIDNLISFQFEGGRALDYSYCYPRASFDKQSIMWDLNYFKYYFLKLCRISFDEQLLEDAFNVFAGLLLRADCNYFLYRDFQSRNIMLKGILPYFIDYQGGRRGAIYYDIASLLFDSLADLPFSIRAELLEYYKSRVNFTAATTQKDFDYYYYLYVLIRVMQALGAYGFRGLYEGKRYFVESISYAVRDISFILDKKLSIVGGKEFGEIILCLEKVLSSDYIASL